MSTEKRHGLNRATESSLVYGQLEEIYMVLEGGSAHVEVDISR